jgi:quinol monooxygenase YgiN
MKSLLVTIAVLIMAASLSWADNAGIQLTPSHYKDYLEVKTPVVLLGIVHVKAQDVERFIEINKKYKKTMLVQTGNLAWSLDQSLSNSSEFIWIEEWRDGRSLARHIESATVRELSAEVKLLSEGPTSVIILRKN